MRSVEFSGVRCEHARGGQRNAVDQHVWHRDIIAQPARQPGDQASPAPVGLPSSGRDGRACHADDGVAATTPAAPNDATTVVPNVRAS